VSTQSLVDLPKYRLSHHHDIHPSTSTLIVQSQQQTTLMLDHSAYLWTHPVDHAQPPGSHGTPWHPSLHTLAYLSTHTFLTHGQTVSGPMAPARPMATHHPQLVMLTHILGWTTVPVDQPHYGYRSPYLCPGTYMTQSFDPVV